VQRTALISHCRGILAEFGIIMPLGADKVQRLFAEILDDEQSTAPLLLKDLLK
jgi:hypothetical protein